MKIVGLDPGFANLGWVECTWSGNVLQLINGGTIVTKPTAKKKRLRAVDDNLRRVREQARQLMKLFADASLVCMESFTLGPKGTRHSAAKQGGSTATIVTLCEAMNKPLLQATPQEIKKEICGNMKASKDDVRDALIKRHPSLSIVLARLNKGQREHCSDALGAVLACLDTETARLCLATENSTSRR